MLSCLLLVLIGTVGTLAVLTFRPPSPLADAPPEQFAAGRAERHLAAVAQRPHPIGTPDNARVRRYLADTARSYGAEVTEQTDRVVVQRRGVSQIATVHNVVARLPGTRGGKELVLLAHYDSVPTGPGAADNGAAVAAMLETMRALTETEPMSNDVVFLFTDGEEFGLLGAEAYVRRHGVDDIGAVLNFESRGNGGPVWMFETGPNNTPLISAFADAGPRPIANSMAAAVYRLLPNDTDFTVFADAGVPGLNSAFIEGIHHYHAATDDLVRLDRGSVQHHGETMLGLVHALGDAELGGPATDSVYFDLFSRVLVHYPVWLAVVLAVVTVAALAVILWRVRPSLRGVLAVLAVTAGSLLVAGGLSVVAWWLLAAARPELGFLPRSEPYNREWFVAGFLVLALAVLLAATRLVRGRTRTELVAGPLVLTSLLLMGTVVLLPGASFLFQWTLLAGLPALWFADRPRLGPVTAATGPVVAAAIYPPLVSTLLVALGLPFAAVAVVFALLAAALLIPVLASLPRPAAGAVTSLTCACILLAVGAAGVRFTPENPRPESLVYLTDGARSHWLSPDPSPGPWTERVLGSDPERVDLSDRYSLIRTPVLRAPAPTIALPRPTATPITDHTTSGSTRTVRFRVTPAPSTLWTQVKLPRTCRSGSTPLSPTVELYSTPTEITCTVSGPLTIELTDYRSGLPETVAALAGPRPPESTTVPFRARLSDSTLVRAVVTL